MLCILSVRSGNQGLEEMLDKVAFLNSGSTHGENEEVASGLSGRLMLKHWKKRVFGQLLVSGSRCVWMDSADGMLRWS
jgi:hypothetical protein